MTVIKRQGLQSDAEFKSLPEDLRKEREKELETFKNLVDSGVPEHKAEEILSFTIPRPILTGSTNKDVVIEHRDGFSFITIGNTKAAQQLNTYSTKFSVFAGNGLEPRKNKDGSVFLFDVTDEDQSTIAAQFHVSPITNISTKKIVLNGNVLTNRSAIKARADVLELKGSEMVIIKSGDRTKNSAGARVTIPGGVHIYSGDNNAILAQQSQPMVLGDNLVKALSEIYKMLEDTSTSILDMNIDILTMKLALVLHFHPPFAPPSPSLALQFPIEMISGDIKRILNAVVHTINHKIETVNRTIPATKSFILSRYNTVN